VTMLFAEGKKTYEEPALRVRAGNFFWHFLQKN
jgi:hypothetical protein